jgi:hypothetical protein
LPILKATGRRGDWFTEINGNWVPCAWSWWLSGNHYCDPGYVHNTRQWPRYVAAIESMRQVALTGKKETTDGKWQRDGYIGLFTVVNVLVTSNTLEFDLIQPRIASLK